MTVDYRVGDTRAVTATIPADSVSLVACSPPFLALRSYLPDDHPAKDAEIGSEPDPATFIDTLLAVTAEWGRVLAPWGSIAIELGDSYTGAGGYGSPGSPNPAYSTGTGDRSFEARWEGRTRKRFKRKDDGWPKAKSLALIPQAYAMGLAYGINPLTGRPSPAGRWRVRNMIVWHRPNPAVGALGDKFRPSTSYIVVATRDTKRWFDLTAVSGTSRGISGGDSGNPDKERLSANPAGAPPLDCWTDEWDGSHDTWTVTTQPSSLAHYAMWPARLAERLILSMCPAEVCAECGEPRRRIEHKSKKYAAARKAIGDFKADRGRQNGLNGSTQYHNGVHIEAADIVTIGWTDCGHDNYRPGVVLDPFAGTGTTLAVADLHRRDAIGIDIDARNANLYPARLTECRKALFRVAPELPGQLDLFGEAQ